MIITSSTERNSSTTNTNSQHVAGMASWALPLRRALLQV